MLIALQIFSREKTADGYDIAIAHVAYMYSIIFVLCDAKSYCLGQHVAARFDAVESTPALGHPI